MYPGPDPHTALCLIDRLDLYDTIFTDPKSPNPISPKTKQWSRAYGGLSSSLLNDSDEHLSIRKILLRDREDRYLAWLLVALVPWANIATCVEFRAKKSSKLAAELVAREGLKRSNNICRVVRDAALHVQDIIEIKNACLDESNERNVPSKRKYESLDRGNLGMKVRQWGPQWRSCVVFALALELKESEDHQRVFKDYTSWLSAIQCLNIEDAYELKHIIDGGRLKELCSSEGGPWMKEAMDLVMEWQLRNPDDPQIASCEFKIKEWWEQRKAATKAQRYHDTRPAIRSQ